MDAGFAFKFFGALFAIMNPVTNLPVFLSVTEGARPEAQRAIALKVATFTAVMGVAVALAGRQILALFGISIDDLRVAGGLVVLMFAFKMLSGEESSAHHGTASEKAGYPDAAAVAFYPLTFPILMGPGTITTLVLFTEKVQGVTGWAAYFAVFAAVVASVGVVFSLAGRLGKHLSGTTRVIMSRLMGMILAAIAIDMIFSGAKVLLPGLAN